MKILSLLKWLIILALIVAASVAILVSIKLKAPATTESLPRDFEIRKGDTAGQIVNRLQDEKLVRNKLLMGIYLRWKNAEDKLQAGVYILNSNMTIPEIVQILSQGKVKANGVRLIVVEGSTVADVAVLLQNREIMKAEQFTRIAGVNPQYDFAEEFAFLKSKPETASLEGFLFPDTYVFKNNSDAVAVAKKMLENFGRRVTPEMIAEAQIQKRSLYDVLILASIVEREVGRNYKKGTKLSEQDLQKLAEERRIVAGIFYNRLSLNMGLESDATLQYVTGSESSRATIVETKIDSPYNTYKYRGLPPTPIGNPSLDAIKAAINPTETDYLYFLTEPDGTAHFAKTLDEHKKNRVLYLD